MPRVLLALLETISFFSTPTIDVEPFFIDPQGWASTMLENGTEQSYIDTMSASAPSWLLAVIIIGTLAIAAFSGWIGGKLLKKQFEKAGITA